MLLRGSTHRGEATWATTIELAQGAMGETPSCEDAELAQLIGRAAQLSGVDARAKPDSSAGSGRQPTSSTPPSCSVPGRIDTRS